MMSRLCWSCFFLVSLFIIQSSSRQLQIGPPEKNLANRFIEELLTPHLPNTKILIASKNKNVEVNSTTTCAVGSKSCIPHLSDHETDKYYHSSYYNISCRDVWCNNTVCSHNGRVGTWPATADVTGNSQQLLENCTNVISDAEASKTRSYVLRLSGNTRSWGDRKELINLYINSNNAGLGGHTHSYNYILQVEHVDSNRVRLVGTVDRDHETVAVLTTGFPHQITVMSDKTADKFAVLINGSLATLKNGAIARYNIFPPTDTYSYNFLNWKIFNRKLTSLEQAALMGESPQLIPSNSQLSCVCPEDYPIFVRLPYKQPHIWFGFDCMNFTGGKIRRVPESINSPLFLTDGVDSTYWISGINASPVKFTIHLGTKYHVFMAKIKTETIPESLLIEAQLSPSDPIRALYLFSNNGDQISDSVRTHRSYDAVNIYSNEILAHWIKPFRATGSGITNPLRNETSRGVFLARTIYVTFTGFSLNGTVHQHMIRGIDIYGACGCDNYETCTVDPTRVIQPMNETEGKRAAPVIDDFTPITQQVKQFTHTDINGFKCNCPVEQSGDLCENCGLNMWRDSTSIPAVCRLCNCGEGSSSVSCDGQGQCSCDKNGTERVDLADKHCNSFVWKVFPSFGPVAGGTEITLKTGWFDFTKHTINIGKDICAVNMTRSNSTVVVCKTPPVSSPRTVTVTVNTQTASRVNFEYRKNPNITYIGRTSLMISGGVAVEVKGTNLNSISSPYMKINIICKLSGQLVATPQAICTVLSPDSMKCNTPNLEPVLNKVTCNFQISRSTASPTGRQRREAHFTDNIFVFHYGFILDGYDEFDNSSKPWIENGGTLVITQDPTFVSWPAGDDVKTINKPLDELLEIDGDNLNSGADMSDYIIQFGLGFCDITKLTANRIFCRLPAEEPEPGPAYRLDGSDKLKPILVSVGNQKEVHIGYVKYLESDPTEQLTIILPVVISVIIIIIVIVIIVCVMRKRRNEKRIKLGSAKNMSRYVAGPHGKVMILDTSYLTSGHMTTLKPWLIEKENLTLGSELGQGQFGKVCVGFLRMKSGNTKQVAVKTMKGELIFTDSQAVSNFLQEAILMKDFQHANVLSLVGVVLNEEDIPMVVLPFMSKGDMKHVLKDEHHEFTVGDLMHFALQVATGMDYLQKKKFVHRDLAARNCMVNEMFLVKIADFGLSHDIYAQDYYRVQDRSKPLPVKWMAIESLVSGKYTTESDVWSYGVLVWEILTRGATPYPGVANYQIKSYLEIGQRLQKPDYCPDELYELMNSCWDYVPSSRPTFEGITEMLSVFLSDDDYTRDQTADITDDYYAEESAVEDLPVFVNLDAERTMNEEYDVAAPFSSNSEELDEKPNLNTNNNANPLYVEPRIYIKAQPNDYLKPKALPRYAIPSECLSDRETRSGYLEFQQF